EATSGTFPYCSDPGLNFSATNYSEDDADFAGNRRGKASRQDPLSHRIIEKRRRDRMNACLADLSRLIPSQYMRKGRGRVEKTEIIEMAIRHLKNLQTQEVLREATYADYYRSGYSDCVTEAAKFLLRERDEELYYKMITHLREHMNEAMKGDKMLLIIFKNDFLLFLGEYFKTRCNGDMINAGSPTSYHHPNPPLSQLREMLTTSVSDVEHNSDDHHDIKDLSFRSNPQQAPSVSSTGVVPSNNIHHMDTSDYDSTRSPTTSSGTTSTNSIRMTPANVNHHLSNLSPPHAHENVIRTVRMRKLSETSTDVEHCNNNYKFKNYIQQRFTHETYHSEESMQSNQCVTDHEKDHDKKSTTPTSPVNDAAKRNGIHHDIKNEILVVNSPSPAHQQPPHATQRNGKIPNGTVNGNINGNAIIPHHTIPIPVFACHTQGFYVPLNVDYDLLIPFLGGVDLLSKTYAHLPPLHPISINVNYTPTLIKNAIASANFIKPKVENGIINGW
ncbi:CLUMA_CG001539, isoform A, partial [Clunio marinus]